VKLVPSSNGVRPVDPLIKGTARQLRDREPPIEKSPSKGDPLHHRYLSHPPDDELPSGEQAILRALIQYHPSGLRREQLTVLTGYARSTRDAYINRLKQKGLVDNSMVLVFVTDAGREAMPNAEPLPTGDALRDFWYRELPDGERAVLQHLVAAYPEAVEKPAIDEATGYQRSTRDAYINRLRNKQLVTDVGRGAVRASETLFEVDA
jgi:DNA-binding MarR family transcriptional regulator